MEGPAMNKLQQRLVRWLLVIGLMLGFTLGSGAAAPADTYGLFVSGLGGDEKFTTSFVETGRLLYESAIASGMDEDALLWLSEDASQDRRIRGRSTKDLVLSSLGELKDQMKKDDLLWIVFIGHGSYRDQTSKINLPGPDLTDRDLGLALAAFPNDRAIVFVNTASASGGFLEAVSGEGRVVLTATKSAAQKNETVFGTFFASAFAEGKADSNQDGFVSALEAFVHANELVKGYYEDRNLLVTENALLDDNGDGQGSLDPDVLGGEDGSIDGALAAKLVLGAAALSSVERTPENLAMLERKSELQRKLDALRRQKATLEENLYLQELQSILVEIARIDRNLRQQSEESAPSSTASQESGS